MIVSFACLQSGWPTHMQTCNQLEADEAQLDPLALPYLVLGQFDLLDGRVLVLYILEVERRAIYEEPNQFGGSWYI